MSRHLAVDGTFKSTKYVFLGNRKSVGKICLSWTIFSEINPWCWCKRFKMPSPVFLHKPELWKRVSLPTCLMSPTVTAMAPGKAQTPTSPRGNKACRSHPLPIVSAPVIPTCALWLQEANQVHSQTKAAEAVSYFPNNPLPRGLLQIWLRESLCWEINLSVTFQDSPSANENHRCGSSLTAHIPIRLSPQKSLKKPRSTPAVAPAACDLKGEHVWVGVDDLSNPELVGLWPERRADYGRNKGWSPEAADSKHSS